MLLNGIAQDLTRLSKWSGKSKAAAAREIGLPAQRVTELQSKRRIVNSVFVRLVEAFGYDIEIRYIKRENGNSSLNGQTNAAD